MKRGKSKGKGKAKNVNKPLKWRARYEPAAKRKTGYDKVLYPVQDIVDQTPPSKKIESEVNWKNAFDPIKTSDRRTKADVHCINKAREAKGQAVITTPDAIMQQRKIDHIINSEAKFYSKLSDMAEKSRVNCEVSYYSKAEHRKSTALKYKGRKFPVKAKSVGPPNPNTKPVGKVSSTLIYSKGYSFANKKPLVTTGVTPSGRPLSDFEEGGKYPPKKQEVTQCSPVWPKSVMTKEELERESRNNPSFIPNKADVSWHINNVPPDDWPDIIREHTYYASGGWKADNQKLSGGKADVLNRDYESLEKDYQDLQLKHYREKYEWMQKHEEHQNTVGILYEELHVTQSALKLAELHSVTSGQHASQVESPLPVSELATLFNVFKSQWNDDPLNAFCRIHNVPKGKRQALKYKFDRECDLRVLLSDERSYYRRLSSRAKVYETPRKAVRLRQEIQSLRRLGNHAGYAAWLQNCAPSSEYVTQCNRRNVINKLRYERGVHSKWATTNRTLGCNKSINNRIEVIKAQEIERIKSIMDTKTYKVLKAVKDVMTIEVNPWARKKQAAEVKRKAALKKKSLKAKAVKASKIKELQDKKLKESDERQKVRDAMRIAH